MPLPDDLKNYSAQNDDSFQLISPELAGMLLLVGMAALLVLERMGML